eukprot:comp11437_c0_seq1/m.5851 comp11437_c0_seq1/g.5851  ORF comp11437_c0_seq1/g.5851 comp11437_c0_seq1/m.5851 type:complete len:219 (-) comp11437_c0_seq1:87-743(-)
MMRAMLFFLVACAGLTCANFFEADVADTKTGAKTKFLLSDTKALPRDGLAVKLGLGMLNVTSFASGGVGKKCEGDQLDVGVAVSVDAGVSSFSPRIRIQKFDEEHGWQTLKMGLLGINVDLDFTLPQLAGPSAPSVFEPGKHYEFSLHFKDAEMDTPIGQKAVCVNLNTREIVAKVMSFKWLYYDIQKDLGDVFYMNMYNSEMCQASIRVCLKGEGQC